MTTSRSRVRASRRIALVLVLGLVGLVLGGLAAMQFSTRDLGRSTVLLRPLSGNAYSTSVGDTLVDLRTDSQLARSDTVLDRVAATNDYDLDALEIRRGLSVRPVDNAEVVVVAFRGNGPVQSMHIAERVAEELLALRAERAVLADAARAVVLEAQLSTAEKQLVSGRKAASNPHAVSILSQRIAFLRTQMRSAYGGAPYAGTVLATSAPPQSGVRGLQLALLGGTGLAGALAGLWLGARLWPAPEPRRLEAPTRAPARHRAGVGTPS